MAEHICWGELVGELTHILARAKRMKKFQRNADVYWEVDELSHQQKEWYLDPNNAGFKNFIHDKPYTTKADLYRIRFYGPKVKVDATKPPAPKAKKSVPHIHGNPAFTIESVGKKFDEALAKRVDVLHEQEKRIARTWDITKQEEENRARIPTPQEQEDVRENGMLGEGTRDHLVVYVHNDGRVGRTENVTFTEALQLARNAQDCLAYVTKIVQVVDMRKTPLERARDRVHMVLENLRDDAKPDDREMLDLYAAVEAWKQVAGETATAALKAKSWSNIGAAATGSKGPQ